MHGRAEAVLVLALTSMGASYTGAAAQTSLAWSADVDFTQTSKTFMGLGGLSGGGGTSRLLYDYAEPQRSQVLDALFLPKAGGNLQILKVEIGGDGQSTEATEASHMHSRDDLNFERGYEWWLMVEAKRRNPDVKLYGLSWAVPGWIGNGSFYEGDDNIEYHLKWVEGAKSAHNLTIDYLGIWNERNYDADWVIRLRRALDARGHSAVTIVAADTSFGVCDDFAKNATLAAAIGVVGAHYPITRPGTSKPIPASCHSLGKPLWTSEGWSLGEVNDWAGALNLGATINFNWIEQQQQAMVVWTVIYAWYSILPFAHPDQRDPIGGMGHGLMSADEPWSGHYRVMAPLYMLAHTTQFVRPGCKYVNSSAVAGGGVLNIPSSYGTPRNMSASMVAFVCEDDKSVTMVVETSETHLPIKAEFALTRPWVADTEPTPGTTLHLFETCDGSWFVQKDELLTATPHKAQGRGPWQLSATLQPQCVYTISTAVGQSAVPRASPAIPSPQRFPFPYRDDFEGYPDQGTVKYFTDQGGSFNAAPAPGGGGSRTALHQVVDTRPIEWGHNPDPVTIAGDITWTDYTVSAKCMVGSPSPLPGHAPAPAPVHELFTVDVEPCDSTSAHQRFAPKGGATATATAAASGAIINTQILYDTDKGCLGPGDVTTHWGVNDVAVVACNSSDPRQLWTASAGRVCLSDTRLGAHGGGCLNLDGGRTAAGNDVLLWAPNAQKEEKWVVVGSAIEFKEPHEHQAQGTAVCLAAGKHGSPPPPPPPPSPFGQPSPTSIKVCGRIATYSRGGTPPNGYCLIVDDSGAWFLSSGGAKGKQREVERVVAGGKLPGALQKLDIARGWITLGLTFKGSQITPSVNGTDLAPVSDDTWSAGMVGLGSGWNAAWFADFALSA